MVDCTFVECLPVCISGIVALIWTAIQEWRIRKLNAELLLAKMHIISNPPK